MALDVGRALRHLRYGAEPHSGAKRERTLAITVGPWGGVWFTGRRRLIWRLCLGFVAITYVPAEMTQILEAWIDSGGSRAPVDATARRQLLDMMSDWSEANYAAGWMSGTERMLHQRGGCWEILGREIGWPLDYEPTDEQWVSWEEAGRIFAGERS